MKELRYGNYTFSAHFDGYSHKIYDEDDNEILYFVGSELSDKEIIMAVRGYFQGFNAGVKSGVNDAQAQIKKALGL